MYGKAFGYSLKYFFKSAVWVVMLTVMAACVCLPLVFTSTPAIPIAVYDFDDSAESKRVVAAINATDTLTVAQMDYDSALNALETGTLEAMFEIKEGFGEAMASGVYEGTVLMRLSNYSTGAATLSDAVAAAVMQEYSLNYAANAVLDVTGSADLAHAAMEQALASDLEIISVTSAGLTSARADDGVAPSLSILAALLCFIALCFPHEFTPSFIQKALSVGARPLPLHMCMEGGKLFPFTLLCAIPCVVGGDFTHGLYVGGVFLLYSLCLCAICAPLSRLRPALRLNIAAFFCILNAIFVLSAVFASAPFIAGAIFPGYWLSSALGAVSVWPPAALCVLTAVAAFIGSFGVRKV